eukprot:g2714.t1
MTQQPLEFGKFHSGNTENIFDFDSENKLITISSGDVEAVVCTYGATLYSVRVVDRKRVMREVTFHPGREMQEKAMEGEKQEKAMEGEKQEKARKGGKQEKTREGEKQEKAREGEKQEEGREKNSFKAACCDGFFGSTIGPVANRIAGGTYTMEGEMYQCPLNDGGDRPNTLHGGPRGFHSRVWRVGNVNAEEASVELHLDGVCMEEDGFPGTVNVTAAYSIKGHDLTIRYTVTALDVPTPCMMTNHAYWKLDDAASVLEHHALTLHHTHVLPVDGNLVPNAPHKLVETSELSAELDSCFVTPNALDAISSGGGGRTANPVRLVAELSSSASGISMQVLTDMPALQVYAGSGVQNSAVCLEAQFPPNAINNESLRNAVTVSAKGGPWSSTTIHRFSHV